MCQLDDRSGRMEQRKKIIIHFLIFVCVSVYGMYDYNVILSMTYKQFSLLKVIKSFKKLKVKSFAMRCCLLAVCLSVCLCFHPARTFYTHKCDDIKRLMNAVVMFERNPFHFWIDRRSPNFSG